MRVIPVLLSVYYNRKHRKTTLVTFCFDKIMFLLMCVVEARSYSITLTFHGSVHLIVVRVSDRIGANADHGGFKCIVEFRKGDRKSTRLNSSHANISYAVFCLKKKKIKKKIKKIKKKKKNITYIYI